MRGPVHADWAYWQSEELPDPEAVSRVVRGEHPLPRLTRAEARHATTVLTLVGESAEVIANRVRVSRRTIHRWRALVRAGYALEETQVSSHVLVPAWLHQTLDVERATRKVSWSVVASQTGVSLPDLAGLQQGVAPTTDQLVSLLWWLGREVNVGGMITENPR